jgi:hypothetical protein
MRPKWRSLSVFIAPIRIGTTVMSMLRKTGMREFDNKRRVGDDSLCKNFPNIWQVHLYAMLIFVSTDIHVTEVACSTKFGDSY